LNTLGDCSVIAKFKAHCARGSPKAA
jgi:hypothetical protein